MPLANFKHVILDSLYLPFVLELLEVIAACNSRGAFFSATSAYRDFKQQLVDWQKGRTTPGHIVTDAGPGESSHNFGLATDFARIEKGVYLKDPAHYAILGEETQKRGLVWGGTFHHLVDAAHVQWPGFVSRAELAPLKAVYLANPASPLSAVFKYLDTRPVPAPGDGGPAGGARQGP